MLIFAVIKNCSDMRRTFSILRDGAQVGSIVHYHDIPDWYYLYSLIEGTETHVYRGQYRSRLAAEQAARILLDT